jgi:DNA-binding FadR family transcriptional regulator
MMTHPPFSYLERVFGLTSMKRELKPEEHGEIVKAIAAGDRVKAKSIYLSATEGNLTEAQNFIKALAESEAAEAQSAGTH